MEEISEVFDSAEQINLYNEGKKTSYSSVEGNYEVILECWNNTINGALEMPAYGVSLNNLTVQEMQKNLWLEFDFGKSTMKCRLKNCLCTLIRGITVSI